VTGTTVVIGAGPYGLSVAAGLERQGLPASWSATSLWDPARVYSLDRYAAIVGAPPREPISLALFQDYCDWFRRRAVQRLDPACTAAVAALCRFVAGAALAAHQVGRRAAEDAA
jgi:hypothetical protein